MQAVDLADGLDRAQKQAVQMGRETVMTVPESDPSRNVPFESDCSLSAFTKGPVRDSKPYLLIIVVNTVDTLCFSFTCAVPMQILLGAELDAAPHSTLTIC